MSLSVYVNLFQTSYSCKVLFESKGKLSMFFFCLFLLGKIDEPKFSQKECMENKTWKDSITMKFETSM